MPVIRQTRQREAIEWVLRQEERPLTPPEIHELAKQRLPGIGLRTIYRHIKDLCDEGKMVGVDYPGQPLRYEMVGGNHHSHFICRGCKRTLDLQVEVTEVAITPPKGFSVTGQETIFYGLCPDCNPDA